MTQYIYCVAQIIFNTKYCGVYMSLREQVQELLNKRYFDLQYFLHRMPKTCPIKKSIEEIIHEIEECGQMPIDLQIVESLDWFDLHLALTGGHWQQAIQQIIGTDISISNCPYIGKTYQDVVWRFSNKTEHVYVVATVDKNYNYLKKVEISKEDILEKQLTKLFREHRFTVYSETIPDEMQELGYHGKITHKVKEDNDIMVEWVLSFNYMDIHLTLDNLHGKTNISINNIHIC